jgi:hypothetical protein
MAKILISTFMCLWAIYVFPQSIWLFFCRKYVDQSWEYINRSQTHDCGNWDWGLALPRKGIYKLNFLCSAPFITYTCHWNLDPWLHSIAVSDLSLNNPFSCKGQISPQGCSEGAGKVWTNRWEISFPLKTKSALRISYKFQSKGLRWPGQLLLTVLYFRQLFSYCSDKKD